MKRALVKDLPLTAHTVTALRREGIYTIIELAQNLHRLHLLNRVGPVRQQEILKAYQEWKEQQ